MLTRTTTIALALLLTHAAVGIAQPTSILASAERLAAETVTQADLDSRPMRLSPGRLGIGIAAAVAGVAMMTIDPEQPTQPLGVSQQTLTDTTIGVFAGLTSNDVITLRRTLGGTVLVCEPYCIGAIDEAIVDSFIVGAATGITAASVTIDDQGWRLHDGPIQAFEERSNALKYGGAALAVAGVFIAGFWSHVPVLNQVAVIPTPGGLRASASIGF